MKDLDFYCVIDIFSKYAWVVPLKDKKGVSIVNVFKKCHKGISKNLIKKQIRYG